MEFKYLAISRIVTPELLKLLNENIIGTPGHSLLYQHKNVQSKIRGIENPYFVNLVKNDIIIGSCCFCNRDTFSNDKNYHSFYIRYFTFKEVYRKKFTSIKRLKSNPNAIKSEIKSLLEAGLGKHDKNKFFHYAYVDNHNERSASISNDFGFETIREFSTIIFNRFYPKAHKDVQKISEEDTLEIKGLLKSFYKDFNMFSFENFNQEFYYTIKDPEGNILVGAQANVQQWKIIDMPGLVGKIMLNTFPKLPFLRKIIHENYDFLSIEFIYFKSGYEHKLESLFEGLLAQNKVYSSLIWADVQTNLYKALKSLNLGLIHKLNKPVNAKVIAKFVNFGSQEISAFKKTPSYISATDTT